MMHKGLSNALGALSNDFGAHIGAFSNNIDALLNDSSAHIGELDGNVGALETWRIAADPKILTLQDFDMVFYDVVRNLHDGIDDAAEHASNALVLNAALSNDLGGRIGALSNTLVTNYIQKDDKLGSLYSNDGMQTIGNLEDHRLEGLVALSLRTKCLSHTRREGANVLCMKDLKYHTRA